MDHVREIREARVNSTEAWKEMLISVEKFMEAEATFADTTRAFREKHRIPPGQPLSVEAIIERGKDAVFQESVNDCRYFRERTLMFAALHQAAVTRNAELTRYPGTSYVD